MMNRTNLRELARQYADGTLDQTTYRRARAELIAAVLGEDDTDPSATDPNTDFAAHRRIAETGTGNATGRLSGLAHGGRRTIALWITVSAVLVAILAILLALLGD